ncbi:MAG: hypothetical protein LBF62_05895 [Tannerellaceae bacterium]|jgi:hypothetical protein|nr:hypothetical protein [Tannerellaceae bacterium]
MSEKIYILKIVPPENMDKPKAGEVHKFAPYRCPHCHGEGGFNNSGWMGKFKKNMEDPDLEICPVCKGTGQLEANVVVGWVPAGEVKKPFKQ